MVSCPCRASVVLFRIVPVLAHRVWPIWPTIVLGDVPMEFFPKSYRVAREQKPSGPAVFSFLYLKKNIKNICRFWKISKIYPGRPMGGDKAQMYFFFFKFATKSLEKKKKRGPVAPPTGDRPLSHLGWATGACRPLGGRQAPPFFYSRDFVANLKKNYI